MNSMKRKVLLSPLIIIIMIIIFGVGIAGAAIYFGGEGRQGDVSPLKGLVGWWKFDGNAKDSTSNANHGTVTGAGLTTDRKGEENKAYNFNGTTDHIAVPDNTVLKPTGAVTVEFWVRAN
jgi:hypothetical protein